MNAINIEPPPLREVWPRIHELDWSDGSFSREKAYVCALFAEAAYWHIPQFELESDDRIKLVPCEAFRELARRRTTIGDVADLLTKEADIERPIVIIRRFSITVVFRVRHVVFVAIRGTKYLYDWLVNLNSLTIPLRTAENGARFHRGFFRAIAASFSELTGELHQYLAADNPVYVTGHSLGGAMAAILHSVWGVTVGQELVHDAILQHRRTTLAAYTFGMPRYGNSEAVVSFRNPYHVYNERDIVPSVPPRRLGFDDCLIEYRIDGMCLERVPRSDSASFAGWLFRLATGIGIRAHSIERYRRGLS